MSAQMVIKLGETGPDFSRRYPSQITVQHQPAGVDFYSVRWSKPPHGTVRLDLGSHAITLKHVLSLQSVQELGGLAKEGLYEFTLNAGLSEPDLIDHDEARLKTYGILAELVRAGWIPVVERSEPRLHGKARFDYTMTTVNINGLDPAYVPTLAEWMRIESRTPWSFHAPGAYLEVSFSRERTLLDPQKPGSYLLMFSIKSEAENFRAYVDSDDRTRWREVLPGVLQALAAERQKKEDGLKAQGTPIDSTYVDPPIPQTAW